MGMTSRRATKRADLPGTDAASRRSAAARGRIMRGTVVTVAAALAVTGCTSATTGGSSAPTSAPASATTSGHTGAASSPSASTPGSQASTSSQPIDVSKVVVRGDRRSDAAKLATAAVADLERYWGRQLPAVYGSAFTPIKAYYSVDTKAGRRSPSVCGDVTGNAYYCYEDGAIAWDSTGLLTDMRSAYGDISPQVIMAHEFGHAVQHRFGYRGKPVVQELQADCFAGAWLHHAIDDKVVPASSETPTQAAAAILAVKDPVGEDPRSEQAHGNGFDRVNSFQTGYDDGLKACKAYTSEEPVVTELPFTSYTDAASGGNLPYESAMQSGAYDLDDYWEHTYPQVTNGQQWKPMGKLTPFATRKPATCGDETVTDAVAYYCPSDDSIGWNDDVTREIYRETGDFGPIVLLAAQYGKAALSRSGKPLGDDAADRGVCYAGAYSADVILHNRPQTSSFTMSPGDLDEAIQALLMVGGSDGFDLIRAYRKGALDGPKGCAGAKVS